MVLTASHEAAIKGFSVAFFPALFFKMAAVPMAVLMLFLIYYFLPNGRPPLNRVIAAAIGVGVLLEALKYINRLVWPWFQRKLESEYHVFQYSVALIFLGFLASLLVLAGAEWAAREETKNDVQTGGNHGGVSRDRGDVRAETGGEGI